MTATTSNMKTKKGSPKIRTCIYELSPAGFHVNFLRHMWLGLLHRRQVMHTILFHTFCPPKKHPKSLVCCVRSHFPVWLGLSIAKVLSSSLPVVPPSDALGLARPSPSPQDTRQMDRMVTWSFTSSCPILRLESCPCYLCWGVLECTFAFKTLMKKHTSHIFLWLARLARNKSCRNSGPPQPFCKAEHFEVAWVQSPASFLLPHVANSDPKKGNDGT